MHESVLLRLALVATVIGFLAASESATAYHPWTSDGTSAGPQLAWRSGSASPPWDDATKTLRYRLNTLNFPAANLPSIEQAGTALLNGFQSLEELAGGAIRFRRAQDVQTLPVQGDGQVHVYFHTDGGLDPFGTDLSGLNAYAVTYPYFQTASGTMEDADIFFNAFQGDFTWSTIAPSPPAGSSDLEITLVHEALHAVGLLHPVYLASAVWPVGRLPEDALHDRLYTPDDRAGLRRIYPGAAPLGRIAGTVSVGAGAGDRAIVVATDADGIPQAAIHAGANGSYELSLPPGIYTVTAHHASNSTYSGELSFSTATPFHSASTVSGVAVSGGILTPGVDVSCTTGTPTMKLTLQGPPGALGSQVQHLPQGSSGTLRLAVRSTPAATFAAAAVASVDLGPGISAALGTVAPLSASTTGVDVDYTVAANATPGLRNLSLVRTSGERLYLPAVHAVSSTGTLSLAPGPANPTPGGVPTGAVAHPLLQVRFVAGAEDVRLRRLAFAVSGSAPAALGFRLWRDVDANGIAEPSVDERIFGSAAYALADPSTHLHATADFDDIAVTLPAGAPIDLLLTLDAPASGNGDYAAQLDAAGLADQAHGLRFGDVLSPTGSASGGLQSLVDLSAGAPGQFESPAGSTPVAVGASTSSPSIVLRSVVAASSGLVGLEAEVRPLGVAFSGPTHSSPVTSAPGSDIAVTVGGLLDGTSYHWRARPVSSIAGPGAWIPFGSNAETLRDFSRDTSSTTLLLPLEQKDANRLAIASGGTGRARVYLGAAGLNSAGLPVAIEVEVVAAGLAFNNAATATSPQVASGTGAEAVYTSTAAADLRWQARAVGAAGSASAWTDFGGNGTAVDFRFDPGPPKVDDSECSAAGSSGGPGAGAAALAALLLAASLSRRPRATLPGSRS